MSACTLPSETVAATIAFHGHSCPGLTIGLRAAEYALDALDRPADYEMVCVAETDMCGCDAIQFVTGCTFGKGNLIHRDHGKMAFSFWDRRSGRGLRLALRPQAQGEGFKEMRTLMAKAAAGAATEAEQASLTAAREAGVARYMALDLDAMFDCRWLDDAPPRSARVLESLDCAACGERVMESRTRRLGGETLCIPCFEAREQKR